MHAAARTAAIVQKWKSVIDTESMVSIAKVVHWIDCMKSSVNERTADEHSAKVKAEQAVTQCLNTGSVWYWCLMRLSEHKHDRSEGVHFVKRRKLSWRRVLYLMDWQWMHAFYLSLISPILATATRLAAQSDSWNVQGISESCRQQTLLKTDS